MIKGTVVAGVMLLGAVAMLWPWSQAASASDERVLFLGDSLTRRGEWEAYWGAGRVMNAGVDGDTGKGALRRLGNLLDQPPAKVFVMIGINDLGQALPGSHQVKNVLDNHRRILQLLKERAPRAKIFILSVLPVNTKTLGDWFNNLAILEVNHGLIALAAEAGCAYLDLHARMRDPSGNLDHRYTYDGLHLTQAGYAVWREMVEPLL